MTGLTVAERIIVHLGRFIGHCDEYSAPVDVSQNGISQAVRISRAHAAIELKKLKETGMVTEGLAHIKGSRQRRKVYNLTSAGMSRAEQIRNFAEEEGIDVSSLLDLARCDPVVFWDSLTEDERPVFTLACVFRGPFDPAVIGETGLRLVPVDDDGRAWVPENMREAVPTLADPAALRECHSRAADECLRTKDYRGRLHHLARAGRLREAAMLISSKGEELLKVADATLNDDLALLTDVPERHRPRVWELQARVAMSTSDWSRCRDMITSVSGSGDQCTALLLEGEMLSREGRLEEALEALDEAKEMMGSPSVELHCRMAEVLCGLGRHEDSLTMLQEVLRESAGAGSLDRADLLLYQMGRSLLNGGRPEEAIKTISKGMSLAPPEDRRGWHRIMGEAYQAAGMQDRAAEHFRLGR